MKEIKDIVTELLEKAASIEFGSVSVTLTVHNGSITRADLSANQSILLEQSTK